MDNIERVNSPAGMHNPIAHGGDYEHDIAASLDRLDPSFGDHTSHLQNAYAPEVRSATVKVAQARTYTFTDTNPILVAGFQPNRKQIVIRSATGVLLAFRRGELTFANPATDTTPVGTNYYQLSTVMPEVMTYQGELWVAVPGAAPGSPTMVYVLEELYC